MSLPPSDRLEVDAPRDTGRTSAPDQLSIVGLRYDAHHGWYDAERDPSEKKNTFEVDVVVRGWFRDVQNLTEVPDYEQMDGLIREIMSGPSEKLIETLCQQIGVKVQAYLNQASVAYVSFEIAVRKCPPPIQTPSRFAEIRMKWVAS